MSAAEAAPLVREGASEPKRDGPSPEALKKTLLVISLMLVSSFCYLFYQTVFYGAGELVAPWPPPKGQVKVDTPASLGKAAPAQHDDGGAITASPGHHRLRNLTHGGFGKGRRERLGGRGRGLPWRGRGGPTLDTLEISKLRARMEQMKMKSGVKSRFSSPKPGKAGRGGELSALSPGKGKRKARGGGGKKDATAAAAIQKAAAAAAAAAAAGQAS